MGFLTRNGSRNVQRYGHISVFVLSICSANNTLVPKVAASQDMTGPRGEKTRGGTARFTSILKHEPIERSNSEHSPCDSA